MQLNDMLVPELHDIAEKLDISNSKKLDKQSLIYKILDQQAVTSADEAPNNTKTIGKSEKKTSRRGRPAKKASK
jgi:transcription termination factor Rho